MIDFFARIYYNKRKEIRLLCEPKEEPNGCAEISNTKGVNL
jgi:hypothetical protein